MDRWDLVEQAFWDGTFDALGTDWPGLGSIVSQPQPKQPMTTRRKFLRGLGAAGMAAAGGIGGLAAQSYGETNRWNEKADRQRKENPMLRSNVVGRWGGRTGQIKGRVDTPGAQAARAQNAKISRYAGQGHAANEKAAPKPTAAGKLRSRRLFGGFGGGSGDTARDAPKQLSTRYRKGPIYHGLGVVTQGNLRKREGARSDIGGHEAKIESAEHKALNKYVPLIQSRQQLAQTRAAQGSPIKAAYHQYRAGRYGKKAQNKVNKATFKHGGEANPETGQNALVGKLNQGPLLTYRGNDN